MDDLDRAVPAPTEVSYGSQRKEGKKRKIRLPSWLVLVVIAVGAVYLVLEASRDAVPLETVTFETWVCPEALDPEASWAEHVAAGCDPASVEAQVTVMAGSVSGATGTATGSVVTVERVNIQAVDTSLVVETGQGYTSARLLGGNPADPVVDRALSPNAQGTSWTGLFRPRGVTELILVFGPATDG